MMPKSVVLFSIVAESIIALFALLVFNNSRKTVKKKVMQE
jgi:hypothetical protein